MKPTLPRTLFLLLLSLVAITLLAVSCRAARPASDDAIDLAVKATLTALPTPTPKLIEVTRVVEITRLVMAEATPERGASVVAATTPAAVIDPAESAAQAPAGPAPAANSYAVTLSTVEETLIGLVNQARVAAGLAPLTGASELNQAARRHSNDMAAYDLTQHKGSDGSSYGQRMRDAGYAVIYANEAIAWGMTTPQDTMDWFMTDPPHREILLSPQYTELGVSYTQSDTGLWKHYWTIDLGKRAATAAKPPAPTVPAPTPPTLQTIALQEVVTGGCPTSSDQAYSLIPMTGVDTSHRDAVHGDLNLARRGHTVSLGATTLIDMAGPTDPDAPQLTTLVADQQGRPFTAAYQVYDWNWNCGADGCPDRRIDAVEVSLLGVASTPGEAIYAPSRQGEIYEGGYHAAVLYADATQITLGYTRDGSVANGYAVHLDNLCVDPNLLHLYRTANASGRNQLPALRSGEPLGRAADTTLLVAIRDRGTFLDPRSRKDWWR